MRSRRVLQVATTSCCDNTLCLDDVHVRQIPLVFWTWSGKYGVHISWGSWVFLALYSLFFFFIHIGRCAEFCFSTSCWWFIAMSHVFVCQQICGLVKCSHRLSCLLLPKATSGSILLYKYRLIHHSKFIKHPQFIKASAPKLLQSQPACSHSEAQKQTAILCPLLFLHLLHKLKQTPYLQALKPSIFKAQAFKPSCTSCTRTRTSFLVHRSNQLQSLTPSTILLPPQKFSSRSY